MRDIIVYNSKFNVDFRWLFLAPIILLRRVNTTSRSQKASTSNMIGTRSLGYEGPLNKWAFRGDSGGCRLKKKRYPALVNAIVGRTRGRSPPRNYFPPTTNKLLLLKNLTNNKHAVPTPLLVVVSSPNIPRPPSHPPANSPYQLPVVMPHSTSTKFLFVP